MDKIPLLIVAIVILAGVGFWALQSGVFSGQIGAPVETVSMPQGIVLFYGEACPHCKNLEDYIDQNKIEEKLKITRLEVSKDQGNSNLLVKTAKDCGTDISQGAPIPLLYDAQKCYIGDEDVINYLKNEAGIE